MSLSKPIMNLVASYLQNLYLHPIRTKAITRLVENLVSFPLAKKLLFERLIFAPIMQAFSLYTLARFEGKNHVAAVKQLVALYLPILQANWKWLTLFQIINLAFVPPILRVLFMNMVGFGWAMFLASKRRQQSQKKGN
ncbi:Peroxisomal membrane protein PMP22 [Operophtera brumata]|uniref:Peroxisomal membrane protein PMP22 n=1 Tax=Operophtera brumata TaxID=104452 RepID=A0A0L7LFD4_OPEBR|nr:Peroxisomal membrane protein PMP22 [Operophtera brumata]